MKVTMKAELIGWAVIEVELNVGGMLVEVVVVWWTQLDVDG